MNKKSFLLYTDQKELVENLSDEQAGKLFKAIFEYVETGKECLDELILTLAFIPIRQQIDKGRKDSHWHWNWKGGKSTQNHIIRNSTEYKEWRNAVFKRDNYTCDLCEEVGGNLHAHHIKPFATHPYHRLKVENGITLCKGCHHTVHHNLPDDLGGKYYG